MSLGTLSETKRHYQLGMIKEVRQAMDRANKELYGKFEYHIFSTSDLGATEGPQRKTSLNLLINRMVAWWT